MIKDSIPVFKPFIEEEEINAAKEALEMGWLGMGSYVNEFEKEITKICNLNDEKKRNVVAVSTGHAALHLSLLSIGVSEGDEVITPSFNNAADFQAIKACGAEPVFVDIFEDTLCIDVTKIESLITEKTKCIIAMDYDIFLCDHDELKRISEERNIPILHDAAHSFGSSYKGKPIGNQHQYTIFSFDPVKSVTAIDGGAIIVEGDGKTEDLHSKRLIGMTQSASRMYTNSRAWKYDVKDLGYRYHLANLHACIGLAQLRKIDLIRSRRQNICRTYSKELQEIEGIIAPITDFSKIMPFLYYIRVKGGKRDRLRKHLEKNKIDTGIHWQPGHHFSYFKKCRFENLDITEKISSEIVSLPLYTSMSENELQLVINSIKDF